MENIQNISSTPSLSMNARSNDIHNNKILYNDDLNDIHESLPFSYNKISSKNEQTEASDDQTEASDDQTEASDEQTDIQQESSDMPTESSAPLDVNINESEKIIGELVSGISDEDESDLCESIDNTKNNKKYWSGIATLNQMVSSEGPMISISTYQIFIDEIIKDKCWKDQDFKNFIELMNTISLLADKHDQDPDINNIFLNPNLYNKIHDILDKLDTIYVLCVIGIGNKCEMIIDKNKKEYISKYVNMINKIVDTYVPIFIKLIKLIDNMVNNAELSSKLDPIYLKSILLIRDRLISILIIKKIHDNEKNNLIENFNTDKNIPDGNSKSESENNIYYSTSINKLINIVIVILIFILIFLFIKN
jgi:hypothetical protein